MTTLDLNARDLRARDPKARRRWSNRLRRRRAAVPAGDANAAVLTGWILSVTLCLALAAPGPVWAMPWVLAGLLSLSGLAWLGAAITRAGPPADSPHLTAWDVALLLFAASFGIQSAARLGLFGT